MAIRKDSGSRRPIGHMAYYGKESGGPVYVFFERANRDEAARLLRDSRMRLPTYSEMIMHLGENNDLMKALDKRTMPLLGADGRGFSVQGVPITRFGEFAADQEGNLVALNGDSVQYQNRVHVYPGKQPQTLQVSQTGIILNGNMHHSSAFEVVVGVLAITEMEMSVMKVPDQTILMLSNELLRGGKDDYARALLREFDV